MGTAPFEALGFYHYEIQGFEGRSIKVKIIHIKMFGQLRNSIKIVPIKPCRRKACVCFADLEKRMAEGGSIK